MKLKLSEKFPGKRAFITGAASGLGKALCMDFARDGWKIVMSDISLDALEKAAGEVENAGGEVIVRPLDVADPVAYEKLAKEIIKKIGGIDVLINNAGVGDGNLLIDYKIEDWKWLVDINLYGVMYGFKFFSPSLIEQQSGMIISIASAAGFTSAPGMSAYNVAKAGVIALSETMMYELQPEGIDISVVMPTFFKTNVMQYARGQHYVNKFANHMMDRSKTNTKDMSEVILKQAANGKLYIVHPGESRIAWYLKRFAPAILRRQISKNMKLEDWKADQR